MAIKNTKLLEESLDLSVNNNEFVVFDIETTGLDVIEGAKIIQISAIRIKNDVIIDKYSELINPYESLSDFTTKLTGITNEMVMDKENIINVLPRFLEFVGDSIVIAHNGTFDVGFIEYFSFDINKEFHNPLIDTLELARYLFPKSKNHKLDTLCTLLNVIQIQHHNADDDTRVLMECFVKMRTMLLKEKGIINKKPLFSVKKVEKNPFNGMIVVFTSIGNLAYDTKKNIWLRGKNMEIEISTSEIESNILKCFNNFKTIQEFITYYK